MHCCAETQFPQQMRSLGVHFSLTQWMTTDQVAGGGEQTTPELTPLGRARRRGSRENTQMREVHLCAQMWRQHKHTGSPVHRSDPRYPSSTTRSQPGGRETSRAWWVRGMLNASTSRATQIEESRATIQGRLGLVDGTGPEFRMTTLVANGVLMIDVCQAEAGHPVRRRGVMKQANGMMVEETL